MILKNKFSVKLIPNTLQKAYLSYEEKDLQIDMLTFNDKSIRVVLPEMSKKLEHRYVLIEAFVETMDDLIILSQIKDIIDLNSISKKDIRLTLTSTSYSRYDRVMFENKTDGFGAKSFADLINVIGFDSVVLFDCHSDVLTSLINNSLNIEQTTLVDQLIDTDSYNIVSPDKGSLKKIHSYHVSFDKVRDVSTGEIIGMELLYNNSKEYLSNIILDDICEGGRTFIECAKLFRTLNVNSNNLNLYITHGIFSNNAIQKLLIHFEHIYIYFMKKSLYDSLPEELTSKLTVKILINL